MASLIAELVLSEEGLSVDADSAAPSTPSAATVKAEETQPEGEDRLAKAASEIAELRAVIEELKDRIPATERPDVLVKKAEMDELREEIDSMDSRQRLAFGLRLSEELKNR
jgi:hypothetical protein